MSNTAGYRAPDNACPFCRQDGKTWDGDDPTCAFLGRQFSSDNWNCMTMLRLRVIADPTAARCDEHSSSLVPLPAGEFVLLAWYKRRGRTEVGAVLKCPGADGAEDPSARPFRRLTVSDALAAIERATGEVASPPPPRPILRSI